MKSYLDRVNDSSLFWASDDDNDDSDSFSSSSFSSSDGDLDLENGNDSLVPGGDELGQDAQLQEEANPAPAASSAVAVAVTANRNNQAAIADNNDQEPQERPTINFPLVAQAQTEMYVGTDNNILWNLRNHAQSSTMLFRVARCEELPLIRAEIDWKLLQKQIPTYPAVAIGDELATHLLQAVLRTDPPCEVIRDIIKCFPKSCVNMDSFYAACQYASDDAVKFLMRRTMKARKIEGISWGMLAFLGDARIRIKHAQYLLQCVPEALVDPMHGMFGVSPLDRMMSGAFIHGGYVEWVGKLKMALSTAENGSLSNWGNVPFYPFHAMMKRLVSSDFGGVQFGALSFVNSLTACVEAETSDPPFHQIDQHGNLPLHIALQNVCLTNIGVTGERKLIKFLLNANPESAMARDANGKLPIVLAIENGWPVYDIIANACPNEYTKGENSVTSYNNLIIHDVLSCKFHPRFGVSGARSMIRFLIKNFPLSVNLPNHEGCLPLHLVIENGWPCHDLLVAAAPSSLEIRDPRTGLYPFQIATHAEIQVKEDKNSTELSTLYELIRWGPMLLTSIDDYPDNKKAVKRKLADASSEPPQKRKCESTSK